MTPVNTTLNKRILPQKCLAQVISCHEDCVREKEVIQESFCRGRQKKPKVQYISERRKRVTTPVSVHGRNKTPHTHPKSQRIQNTSNFKFQTVNNMLPLQTSDPLFNKHILSSQRTNKHKYAQNKPQFGDE